MVVVWLLCAVIQWYLLAPELDSTALLVGFVSHSLALVATLGLSDRIAIQLLLITPPADDALGAAHRILYAQLVRLGAPRTAHIALPADALLQSS